MQAAGKGFALFQPGSDNTRRPMNADPAGFEVQVLLREEEIVAGFRDALARRFLDEKFFYWSPPSVRAWVELCSSKEYRNADRATGLLRREAPELAHRWKHADWLCGVGCGEGSKDRLLLEAFAAAGARLGFVAADFSQALLELAIPACAPVAAIVRAIKLDVLSDAHLLALGANGRACIYAVLGNTLGAFDPWHFPARLRRILRRDDRALFDGEVFAGEETLRGYDNPTNRRFAFAPLASLGLGEADGELRFEIRAGARGVHEVAKYFVPARELEFQFAGAPVRLSPGEKLLMSSSIKYDEPAFRARIEDGGFRIEHFATSEDGRFLLAAAAPR